MTYDPVQAGNFIIDWRYLVDLLEFTEAAFPLFKVISVDFSMMRVSIYKIRFQIDTLD